MKEKMEPKIIHVMKNGTIRDSIEGVVVPVNEDTEGAYRVIAKLLTESRQSMGV